MEGAGSSAPVHFFDDHRPRCHLAPPAGWMNDPNGPVFYKGRYHMFYQHLPDACEWDFGIVWGHAVSPDLVHWEHLPPALVPTPGWVDADGCFSGCCILDPSGRPVILYTGVRLRSNTAAGPLPPPEQDLGMVWIESQCAAVPADPADDLLIEWKKVERPFLPLPPADMQLTGWRDPFIFATNTMPSEATARSPAAAFGPPPEAPPGPPQYRILMGSGIKGKGGTALVYRTSDLMDGWELEGTLCEGNSEDTGVVWECPLLVPLTPVPHGVRSRHPHVAPAWLHTGVQGAGVAVPRPPPPVRYPSGGPLAALNAQPVASPAAHDEKHQTMATISSLSAGMALRDSGSFGSAAAAAAASPLLPPAAATDGENSGETAFEFSSSGVPSPADLARSGSVELWPSSGELASPVEDAASPKLAGVQKPLQQQQQKEREIRAQAPLPRGGAADHRMVAELAAKLERAATLEHWNEEGGTETSTTASSATAQGTATTTTAGGATIGSKLSSVAGSSAQDDAQSQQQQEEPLRTSSSISALTSAFRPAAPPDPRRGFPHSPFSESTDGEGTGTSEDKFDLAFSRMPALQVRRPLRSEPSASAALSDVLLQSSIYAEAASAGHAPPRQWHFFTVSPDAPTNPVLYWTGFVSGDDADIVAAAAAAIKSPPSSAASTVPRFEIETAKGPYRLDLGDILYAPNVCQDGAGRWLLWGWLQERRKMGTYAYAGCLSLPRVLHVTDEGRLLQAPAPEVTSLRAGREFHAQHVTLYPEAVMPIQRVSGERLDIEVTIERGSAMAAGLLFRSHEAEAEGSTCIVYDWDRNQLEAIFNVPPHWQPTGVPVAALHCPDSSGDVFDGSEGVFDAASFLCSTPRFPLSRVQSMSVFSPLSASPRATADGTSPSSSPDTSSGPAFPAGQSIPRTGSSLAQCLQRSSSFANLGAGTASVADATFSPDSGISAGPSAAVPAGGPPQGIFRTSSTLGTSVPRVGSFLQRQSSFLGPGSPRGSQAVVDAAEAAEMDAELSMLLEDLAAPMRGAAEEPPAPPPEPRRVGGPLLMRPADRLHLRIFVDHSLVEVFTGTGEVLSTRIYRGQAPDPEVPGYIEAGIEFVAFGGAAILEKVSAFEVGSAWEGPGETPTSVRAAAAAVAAAGSAAATPHAVFATQSPAGGAAARADELFDEILMSIGSSGGVAVGGSGPQ